MCIRMANSFCCIVETNNTVKQLYSNKKVILKNYGSGEKSNDETRTHLDPNLSTGRRSSPWILFLGHPTFPNFLSYTIGSIHWITKTKPPYFKNGG